MAKKEKKQALSFFEKLKKIKNAGLSQLRPPNRIDPAVNELETLDERIVQIFELYKKHQNRASHMIYFIMYDIENNKIRTQIAKYLIKKGCVRVQKSIFLASTERITFNEIYTTIKEVQEVYDNFDSIFLVPVSVDQLRSMKIVGQNINYELIIGSKNTLFF